MLPIFLLLSFFLYPLKVPRVSRTYRHSEEVVERYVIEEAKADGAPRQAQLGSQSLFEHWGNHHEKGVGVQGQEAIEAKGEGHTQRLHCQSKYPSRTRTK